MPVEGQWADSLLALEKLHLLKLLIWAVLSIASGTALFTVLRVRRIRSPLLDQFAVQALAWGAVDLLIAIWGRSGLVLRDLAGAVALDRFAWLNVGLDAGYAAVGLTLVLCGWLLGRRLGLVGAGLGVIVQGLALVVLDLQLTAAIVR
jgi:hypothetical protein